MIIKTQEQLEGIKKISEVVALILKQMIEYAQPGMSTGELDIYGKSILEKYEARSAPALAYGFPGYTCISVNNEIAHGVPSDKTILCEGDAVNIDVSAELNGYWADNGASFIIGEDVYNRKSLVESSAEILLKAISGIRGGMKIADVGRIIETEARKNGFKVIKNLGGHGVGLSLHEDPDCILNYYDKYDQRRFRKNSVVAIETFLSTTSTMCKTSSNGWTLVGDREGICAQHEHTILVTSGCPVILTSGNGISQIGAKRNIYKKKIIL